MDSIIIETLKRRFETAKLTVKLFSKEVEVDDENGEESLLKKNI